MFLPTERTVDVHLREPERYEEVADLNVPPGLELVTVPPSVKAGIPGFQVEVVYERTPQGARITRRLKQDISELPKERYAEARREVLVFAPRR